jgi:predicted anti-sigma-YlaC factor YlaD
MEHHLGECDRCRRLLDDLQRTLDALHRLAGPAEGIDAQKMAASVRSRLSEPN